MIAVAASMSAVCDLAGKSANGSCKGIFSRAAIGFMACSMKLEVPPGPNPPSSSGREGSTIILAGSKLHLLPRPWQVSHAPKGLLKENERGSSWGTLAPQSGQASFWEYRRSFEESPLLRVGLEGFRRSS